mmetsp:Transcript_4883/g.15772  ORF Transcript_4883/g.15772 Transcript_4883/m.15772 type:complete len:205 (+) Transcript_4883:192-806(+)
MHGVPTITFRTQPRCDSSLAKRGVKVTRRSRNLASKMAPRLRFMCSSSVAIAKSSKQPYTPVPPSLPFSSSHRHRSLACALNDHRFIQEVPACRRAAPSLTLVPRPRQSPLQLLATHPAPSTPLVPHSPTGIPLGSSPAGHPACLHCSKRPAPPQAPARQRILLRAPLAPRESTGTTDRLTGSGRLRCIQTLHGCASHRQSNGK